MIAATTTTSLYAAGALLFRMNTTKSKANTPLFLTVVGFLMTATRMIYRHGSPVIPLALFLLAMSFHVQAVLLLPACLFLLIWASILGRRKDGYSAATRWIAVTTLAGTVIAAVSPTLRQYFVGVTGTNGDGIVNPTHWVDILNEIVLVFPTIFLFVALALGNRVWKESDHTEKTNPTTLRCTHRCSSP